MAPRSPPHTWSQAKSSSEWPNCAAVCFRMAGGCLSSQWKPTQMQEEHANSTHAGIRTNPPPPPAAVRLQSYLPSPRAAPRRPQFNFSLPLSFIPFLFFPPYSIAFLRADEKLQGTFLLLVSALWMIPLRAILQSHILTYSMDDINFIKTL